MMDVKFDTVDGTIFDADIIGNISAVHEKAEQPLLIALQILGKKKVETTKKRSTLQEIERDG